MANTDSFKVVSKVSDPPVLTDAEIARLHDEGRQLSEEFMARTASMEMLTADDLKIRIR